jgi:RNA polymerase sigma-70 factor (ECF subfamily)
MDQDFERLYKEKFTPIYKYVYFRVRNYDVAMDLCQNIFLKILEQDLDKKIHQETELNYLYTIARNKIIDYFRKKRTGSLDKDSELLRTVEDLSIPRPDQDSLQISDRETLYALLDQLSELDREIIIMRHLQELEYADIAAIVEKEESAVRQIVSRSIKKMKELYEQGN